MQATSYKMHGIQIQDTSSKMQELQLHDADVVVFS